MEGVRDEGEQKGEEWGPYKKKLEPREHAACLNVQTAVEVIN